MTRYFVTGGAGFIGSHLVDRLLAGGHQVVAWDNFSTGEEAFLAGARAHPSFELVRGDLLDADALTRAMDGCEFVFHLAANADVRFGTTHPRKDLEQNTLATFNVLEAMQASGIRRIAFASSSSIYGEPGVVPTPEDAPLPLQTSLYGASKLACEGLIEAYCEGFGFQTWIFRFVGVLGERYKRGHVIDFFRQLRVSGDRLRVLGDGSQRKSYLHVGDCVDGMLFAVDSATAGVSIFNLGTDEYCTVTDAVRWITDELELAPAVVYGGGPRGWIGDNPFVFLDCSRIKTLGWCPKVSIREGMVRTVRYLQENQWLLERH